MFFCLAHLPALCHTISLSFSHRGNFLPNINSSYIKKCNFDFKQNSYCPIFRVGDVIQFSHQNFTTLANKVSLHSLPCFLSHHSDSCTTVQYLMLQFVTFQIISRPIIIILLHRSLGNALGGFFLLQYIRLDSSFQYFIYIFLAL